MGDFGKEAQIDLISLVDTTRKLSDPEPLPLSVKILAASVWFIGAVRVLLSVDALALLSDVEGMVPFAFLGIVGCLNAGSYSSLVITAVILAYLYQHRKLFDNTF